MKNFAISSPVFLSHPFSAVGRFTQCGVVLCLTDLSLTAQPNNVQHKHLVIFLYVTS